uniref:Bromodomain-containing protein 8 n=2 Tax=Accipitrinae TaxID=8955 RepID=A0A8B9N7W0_9AVES
MLQQSSRSPSFAPHACTPLHAVCHHYRICPFLANTEAATWKPPLRTHRMPLQTRTHTHTPCHTGPQTRHLHTRTSALDPTTHRDHHMRDPPHTPNRHNTYTDHHTGPTHTRSSTQAAPHNAHPHAGPAHTGTDRRTRNHRRRSPQAPPSAPDVARPLQRPPLLARTRPRRGPLRLLRLHSLAPASRPRSAYCWGFKPRRPPAQPMGTRASAAANQRPPWGSRGGVRALGHPRARGWLRGARARLPAGFARGSALPPSGRAGKMAAGTGKHKLLSAGPTEPWSIREKLCLASSVMRSGDQNWVSVSRAIKPFAEPGRPPDWFSQKHCASQYSELLETTETPKRKRGEKGEVVETVEDVIVRKLTAERVEELKKMIKETQEKYRQLKKDAELIQAGHMDNRLEELCNEIMIKKKMEEEEAEVKRKATDAAYQARQAIKNPPRRLTGVMVRSPAGSTSPGGDYALGDLSQPAVDEASPGVTPGTLPSTPVASFIGIPDTPPGSAPLDAPMTPVTDDSPQKKMLGQKATPPPSPLLSELLKKGSLLPTSPRLVGENEMAVASGHMNSSGVLLEVGSVLPVLHSGEMQSAPGAVPASPAASGAPTLSRLLEAGPAQFTSPLASFSAVASEPPAKLLPPPVEPVSQATIVMMPTLSAPSVVPPAAAPESVATVSQPEACVSMEAVSDSHTVTVSMDSSEISMIIDSIKKECLGSGAGSTAGSSKDHCMDGKEDLDLAEKMDIAVSYTGEELDFDTVGNIIAIIEDKVDDHPEVLDAAVVEAALSSFCEDTDDPQTLPGPWEHSIRQEHEKQAQIPQVSVTVKQERLECEEPEAKGIRDLMGIGELGSEIKTEPAEQEQNQLGPEEAIPATTRVTETPELRNQEIEEDQRAAVAVGETSEIEIESAKGEDTVHNTVKTETPPDDDSSPPQVPNVSEDSSQADVQHKFELSESMKEEAQALFRSQMKDGQGEEDDEDGASEAASLEEPKEEDQGEGYLSEMDNEPPVSESDDGFSVHNAPLQSHTLADSIPSSPASSQFSVCSEDQEAIQAQKIWKKAIMLVWRAAANHRYANVFLQPVTDDIAPGYHSIVQRPMDLSTIKKNIENGLIRTTAEFQRDIMLMFQNAVMYNSSDHDVYHMAVEMQRDVLEQIQQFLATQLIMQTSESGISAKSLRGRDSTRKQDASEKDSVPMGSPAFLLSLFDGGTRGRRCAIEADMKMKK